MEINPSEEENVRNIKLRMQAREDFTQIFAELDLNGKIRENRFEMNGGIDIWVMWVEAKNTLTMKSETSTHSSKFTLDMDTQFQLEPGSPAVEAKTEIHYEQQSQGNTESITSHLKVRAPNMFHIEFNMKDTHELKNEVVREITTPEETFTIDEFNHRVRINGLRNRARGVDEVEMDLGVIIPALWAYSQDAINSQVISDVSDLTRRIETRLTMWESIINMISEELLDLSDESAMYKIGSINYDTLWIDVNNYEDWWDKKYKVAVYVGEWGGNTVRMFQVKWEISKDWVKTAIIRWSYYQVSQDSPVWLFQHPRTGEFLQNGDTLN